LDKESVNSTSNYGNSFIDGSPLKEIKEEDKAVALPKLKIKCMSRDDTTRPFAV